MRLYDTISQVDLNSVIDKLLGNFHRELSLDLDDPVNNYCSLEFDCSDGVDAGTEVIFNDGDELSISFTNQRLQGINYGIRFYYYQLDKGDYTRSKPYGELQSVIVDLDDDTVTVPFTENQIYLQKSFDLVLMNTGESLLLSADKHMLFVSEDLTLTAVYSVDTLPVEGASVSFYNGETLLDTVVTDEDGEASLTVSDLFIGTYNFSCVCEGKYSKSILVEVVTENMMELGVTGSSFSSWVNQNNPLIYNGKVYIDWGDDSGLVEYTGGRLTHTYASSDDYTIKIYGEITQINHFAFTDYSYYTNSLVSVKLPDSITSLGVQCFRDTGLVSAELPDSITTMGRECFYDCYNLTSIKLKWDTSSEIITYDSGWIKYTHSALKFHIPNGTTSLYTAKSYPSDKLVEDNI